MWFSCKHPANSLFVDRDSTAVKRDDDFTEVTHHLFCMKCGTKVDIGYSMLTKTVSEFIRTGMDKIKRDKENQ